MTTAPIVDDIDIAQLDADPYPFYKRLRDETPVAYVPGSDAYYITRYADCAAVGGGDADFKGPADIPPLMRVFGAPNVLTADGAPHADLRAGIDPVLRPVTVNTYIDDLVRPIARDYLARLTNAARPGRAEDASADGVRKGRAELMSGYFEPVSVESLRRVMGLDGLVDATTLRRWFADLNFGITNFSYDPAAPDVADATNAEIESVLIPLLGRLRRKPDDSMLGHMLWAGRTDGDPRSAEDLLPSLKVILLGGMQEPGHAAGSTLLGLFTRPDQLARLYAAPAEIAPLAVHEGLRWIAPIGTIERAARHDVTIGGFTIPAGAQLEAIVASANRDERQFADPDAFDIDRSSRAHQAFGGGAHFCAGHFFARQAEHIMMEELVRHLPDLAQDGDARVTGWIFRAPKSLPVSWTAEQPGAARETVTLTRPGTIELTVAAIAPEAEGIVTVTLRDPAGADLPQWQPGAHIDLWLPSPRNGDNSSKPRAAGADGQDDAMVRQYSLCGDVEDKTAYRIAVLKDADGRGGSRYVHGTLAPGDTVAVGRPRNHFPLRVDGERYLLVAGGIGITPLRPMIDDLDRLGADWHLVYTGRNRASLAFLGELAAFGLDRVPGRVTVHESGTAGRLDIAALLGAQQAGTVVYTCGPAALMAAVREAGERRELTIRSEYFHGAAADAAAARLDQPFDILIERTGQRVTVPAGVSALRALHAAGHQIPTSCGEGTCGSCETRVLAGRVDHRDVLLTQAQRDRNDRMMVCVSRAMPGEELILDR
jgi:cytochrome P450/ferredoxin-NADP reductase